MINKNQRGFSLIELLVALAITSLISTGITMTTFQMFKMNACISSHIIAITQVESAGYWVSQDALMAQTVIISDDPETTDVEFIILYWKDWETGDTHKIRYLWLDSVDSLKKLKREHVTYDSDEVEIDNQTTLVADNIHTSSLSWQDGIWRLTVEARSGTKSAIRQYEISQRLQIE